jgi:replication factor C subunit 3/5
MMAYSHIPNMLFHGPPGTGKTTTILNIIRVYQERHEESNKGLMLHLNASDERGIETIRTQIYSFVHSKPMFSAGTKFVVLDEVDSMTKAAQQGLCSMLHSYVNVRFCLICNYISRIDSSLQSMFIKIKFNKLPTQPVVAFLNTIVKSERLPFTQDHLVRLQELYGSDLRSMVNYLQSNRMHAPTIITPQVWDALYQKIMTSESLRTCVDDVYAVSLEFNMSLNHVMKDFMYYVWTTYFPDKSFSKDFSIVCHNSNVNVEHMVSYVILLFNKDLKK